ncbi:MAG: Bacterial regulatory protein Fis family [Pseudomonadota bacterium]|jgi:sigma-54 specific flagellar transcriptional regulator A
MNIHTVIEPHDTGMLPERGCSLADELERLAASLIRQALERTGGNKTRAAKLLRIKRTTLVMRMRVMGLASSAYKSTE